MNQNREGARLSLTKNIGGDLGKYLSELDKFVSSSEGRHLVNSINSVFQVKINLGEDIKEEENEEKLEEKYRKVVFDFEEGRIYYG